MVCTGPPLWRAVVAGRWMGMATIEDDEIVHFNGIDGDPAVRLNLAQGAATDPR